VKVGLPVHVPGAAVRVWPSDGIPVMAGATVFVGAACSRAEPVGTTTASTATARSARAATARVEARREAFELLRGGDA
jgi:hypothetical protein